VTVRSRLKRRFTREKRSHGGHILCVRKKFSVRTERASTFDRGSSVVQSLAISHAACGISLLIFGVWLAIFGDSVISATIALLIVLKLFAGLVGSIRELLRARWGA
jgi:hypothetical protein